MEDFVLDPLDGRGQATKLHGEVSVHLGFLSRTGALSCRDSLVPLGRLAAMSPIETMSLGAAVYDHLIVSLREVIGSLPALQ